MQGYNHLGQLDTSHLVHAPAGAPPHLVNAQPAYPNAHLHGVPSTAPAFPGSVQYAPDGLTPLASLPPVPAAPAAPPGQLNAYGHPGAFPPRPVAAPAPMGGFVSAPGVVPAAHPAIAQQQNPLAVQQLTTPAVAHGYPPSHPQTQPQLHTPYAQPPQAHAQLPVQHAAPHSGAAMTHYQQQPPAVAAPANPYLDIHGLAGAPAPVLPPGVPVPAYGSNLPPHAISGGAAPPASQAPPAGVPVPAYGAQNPAQYAPHSAVPANPTVTTTTPTKNAEANKPKKTMSEIEEENEKLKKSLRELESRYKDKEEKSFETPQKKAKTSPSSPSKSSGDGTPVSNGKGIEIPKVSAPTAAPQTQSAQTVQSPPAVHPAYAAAQRDKQYRESLAQQQHQQQLAIAAATAPSPYGPLAPVGTVGQLAQGQPYGAPIAPTAPHYQQQPTIASAPIHAQPMYGTHAAPIVPSATVSAAIPPPQQQYLHSLPFPATSAGLEPYHPHATAPTYHPPQPPTIVSSNPSVVMPGALSHVSRPAAHDTNGGSDVKNNEPKRPKRNAETILNGDYDPVDELKKSGAFYEYNYPEDEKCKRPKRPEDAPRRPMSAYNFFFSTERLRILASIPTPNPGDNQGEKSNTDVDRDEGNGPNKGDLDADTDVSEAAKDHDNNDNDNDLQALSSKDELEEGYLPEPKDNNNEKYWPEDTDAENCSQEDSEKWLEKYEIPINYFKDKEAWEAHCLKAFKRADLKKETKRSHRKSHGKIGFMELARTIGDSWKQIHPYPKMYYQRLAEADSIRYKKENEEYAEKKKVQEATQQRLHQTVVPMNPHGLPHPVHSGLPGVVPPPVHSSVHGAVAPPFFPPVGPPGAPLGAPHNGLPHYPHHLP